MRRDKITEKEIAAVVFVMSLSPGLRVLPRLAAELGGRVSWLAPLTATAPLLLLIFIVSALLRECEEGESLGDMLTRRLGICGRAICIALALWLIFYLGFLARACGERYLSSEYDEGGAAGYIAAVLVLAFFAARGSIAALSRASQIYTAVLTCVLAFVIILSVKDVKAEYILPVTHLDTKPLLLAVLPTADAMSAGVYCIFICGGLQRGRRHPLLIYMGLLMLLLTGVMISTIGTYGAELTERLQNPFFVLIRNIRGGEGFERVEAVVIALWVAADFAMLSVTALSGCELLHSGLGFGERKKWAVPVCLLAGAAAWFTAGSTFELSRVSDRIVPTVHLGICYVLLPMLLVCVKLAAKREKIRGKIRGKGKF